MKKQRTKVFIEKIMPVKMLNEQVQYENGGNPFKGLHRWYSRKPLSFSRASILASLLPADVTKAEFAPVRPEVAFAEARRAIANYRFRKLVQDNVVALDPLTQWYLLAWDAFKAREFDFDEARQLALAIGGFNVEALTNEYKLLSIKDGNCKLLTPKQRLKKRAFSIEESDFSSLYLVDSLHALIAIYEEEHNPQKVRCFNRTTFLRSHLSYHSRTH